MTDDKPTLATGGLVTHICLCCQYEDALRAETAHVEAEIERLRQEAFASLTEDGRVIQP